MHPLRSELLTIVSVGGLFTTGGLVSRLANAEQMITLTLLMTGILILLSAVVLYVYSQFMPVADRHTDMIRTQGIAYSWGVGLGSVIFILAVELLGRHGTIDVQLSVNQALLIVLWVMLVSAAMFEWIFPKKR